MLVSVTDAGPSRRGRSRSTATWLAGTAARPSPAAGRTHAGLLRHAGRAAGAHRRPGRPGRRCPTAGSARSGCTARTSAAATGGSPKRPTHLRRRSLAGEPGRLAAHRRPRRAARRRALRHRPAQGPDHRRRPQPLPAGHRADGRGGAPGDPPARGRGVRGAGRRAGSAVVVCRAGQTPRPDRTPRSTAAVRRGGGRRARARRCTTSCCSAPARCRGPPAARSPRRPAGARYLARRLRRAACCQDLRRLAGAGC